MIRRTHTKGLITQKMMSFRLDNDNALWLDSIPNKGRYINELIRIDRYNDFLSRLEYKDTVTIRRPGRFNNVDNREDAI